MDAPIGTEPPTAELVADHIPEWNPAGYDVARTTRYVYAFLGHDGSRVKIGTVSRHKRLKERLREVANASGDADLRMVAYVAIPDIDGHELEGYEGSIQTYVSHTAGLPFGLAVDWLAIPEMSPVRRYGDEDWQGLLDRALAAIRTGREAPPGH